MSEYQYYEFQAIDRPLGEAEREALRALSSRARITAASFTNHYEWGDFKGDPRQLVERWFDLHLYLANWGTRRLMMRLPKRLMERERLDLFLLDVDWVKVWEAGENLIVDMCRDEIEERRQRPLRIARSHARLGGYRLDGVCLVRHDRIPLLK